MITIKKFSFHDKHLMSKSEMIRKVVFIDEQKVPEDIEYEYEEQGNYYLMFLGEDPIATARWRSTGEGIKLERFAMLAAYRNKGLGSQLLQAVMQDVVPLQQRIYLHSQVGAINYYSRSGFKEVGPHFFEAGIEHVMMEFDPAAG